MSKGVDYSFTQPPLQAIKDEGYDFVGRYLVPVEYGKGVTQDELASINDSGLDLILFFERYETRALEGFDAGAKDAVTVSSLLDDMGLPQDTIVYYCVDTMASGDLIPPVIDYFRGVQSVRGHLDTGGYGGYDVARALLDANLVDSMVQTAAWSDGKVADGIDYYQDGTQVEIQGVTCDVLVKQGDDQPSDDSGDDAGDTGADCESGDSDSE